MGTPIVAAIIVLGLLVLLALFARGGPTETISSGALPPELAGVAGLALPELGSIATRLFTELGFTAHNVHERPDRIDVTMTDSTPVTGQSVYIRCVLPPDSGAVASHEVQSAVDAARGENLAKAIVVTSGIFSDEARLLSNQAPLELIDGASLAQLLRAHLPDVANRLNVPR